MGAYGKAVQSYQPERYYPVRIRKTVMELHEVYATSMEEAIGKALGEDKPKVINTINVSVEATFPGPTNWRSMLYGSNEENR